MKKNELFMLTYNVNYEDIEGNKYTIYNIEATNSYDAECIAAGKVNAKQKFGIKFKAEFAD